MKSNVAALFIAAVMIFSGSCVLQAADPASAARVIKIQAGVDNAMKFDVASITVAPGERIKVVLANASTLPKEVMGHNWVLLQAGTDPLAFAAAGAPEAANGYIPSKLKDKVLAVVGILGPKETGEVTFTAPTAPGEYPFLCTFPAHCQIGMRGVLVVKK
jgi:azurin